MAKFRKKPVVIEAVQFTGDNEIKCMDFVGKKLEYCHPPLAMEYDKEITNEMVYLLIPTLEGTMKCNRFDFIIKGVNGEFYPCKPDIFEKTYEPVTDNL